VYSISGLSPFQILSQKVCHNAHLLHCFIFHTLSASFRVSLVFSYISIYMLFRVDRVIAKEVIESNGGIDIILVFYL
jgi:hypothetical protein